MTAVYPRHGDIYAFDFATGHEQRRLHTKKARESLPAVWRSHLAFVRGKKLFVDGREVRAALYNSFGFGGHNVSLAVKRFED